MKKEIRDTVESLKRENPDVQSAYRAMMERGESPEFADKEIGRAIVGSMYEVWHGEPNRFAEVCRQIGEGKTTAELFPD